MSDSSSQSNTPVPYVVDLGKAKKRQVRKFKQGRGRLYEDAQDVIEEVRARMGADGQGKEIVPVIMLYRKKGRRKGKRYGLFPPFF
jgi:hypothetical protein